jgi:RNA polymerase sigma-70 factor (ECF subfamily)
MSKQYRQWVDQYQDEAWSLARYLLKDETEAEDVTQEAFASLWQHRESMDPQRVKYWLMRVLRNECFDRLRRRKPETEFDEERKPAEGGPMTAVQQEQLSGWLSRAIDALGEPFRSLVILRDLQQHSYEEVGESTGLSPSQVKVYLHRARKLLREQLAEHR